MLKAAQPHVGKNHKFSGCDVTLTAHRGLIMWRLDERYDHVNVHNTSNSIFTSQ